MSFDTNGNPVYTCIEVNECDLTPAPCDTNAVCSNLPGSYLCTCLDYYEGNGTHCTGTDFFSLKTLFSIVEAPFNFFLKFDVCVV